MGNNKKKIREKFRETVFKRDNYMCRKCHNVPKSDEQQLDAHHIISRDLLPNGGYVKENGISLCGKCHIFAEAYTIDLGDDEPRGFSSIDLYELIGSSYEMAYNASLKLRDKV